MRKLFQLGFRSRYVFDPLKIKASLIHGRQHLFILSFLKQKVKTDHAQVLPLVLFKVSLAFPNQYSVVEMLWLALISVVVS